MKCVTSQQIRFKLSPGFDSPGGPQGSREQKLLSFAEQLLNIRNFIPAQVTRESMESRVHGLCFVLCFSKTQNQSAYTAPICAAERHVPVKLVGH